MEDAIMQHDEVGPMRELALLALASFTERLLYGQIRRHGRCARATTERRRQLHAEIQQELRADCVEHAAEILSLPIRERHSRWFRMAERWLYREHRSASCGDDGDQADIRSPDGFLALLRAEAERMAEQALGSAAYDRPTDQRDSVSSFARRVGLSRTDARDVWAQTATQIGYDEAYFAFWRRRLAEALTGLAADRLRDSGRLCLLPRRRAKPDPMTRSRRVQRIVERLRVAPQPHDIRKALAMLQRRRAIHRRSPAELLAAAARLDPKSPTIELWRFESAMADNDMLAAARALRRARRRSADPVAVALSRARLAAMRRGHAAGRAILARAIERHPSDERLRAAWRMAAGSAGSGAKPRCA
jgi:hypothetical protein